ncbi:MAG: pyridoxamine 5'-phosphate oxidase family protein [Burkholderiales bacterium]|nr:pyridoxamine 5'-phosphate oxidase family protein [Burkholderiales bacterium]
MSDRLITLAEIEAEVWHQLERAAVEKQHEWRAPVLATVNGDAADARTVILREVDVGQKQLLSFTDDRAGKVAQLLRHPRATMVMWSRTMSWQLRCRVLLSLEMTGLAATSRWARIKLTPAAQDYLARVAPGTALDTPLVNRSGEPEARSADPLKREYFAVISAQVLAIDWLELHREGHRRAVFDERGARWVQP